MNIIEDFIFFIFTVLFALFINSNYSFGFDKVSCAEQSIRQLNSSYIFIGEDHRDYNAKDFVIHYLPVFKNLGFKTIFVEYIESKDQHILDKFNTDPIMYRELTYATYGSNSSWPFDSLAYLNLTDHIGLNSFNLRGLDRRSDLSLHLNTDDMMSLRDLHMFEVVRSFIKRNPTEKLIFFNGSSHSFVNPNLSSPSFYALFKLEFPNFQTTNIKIDYYNFDSISLERLSISDTNIRCPNDFLVYTPNEGNFDFYIFEDTDTLLPVIDFINSVTL